jgi:hypothetical protein
MACVSVESDRVLLVIDGCKKLHAPEQGPSSEQCGQQIIVVVEADEKAPEPRSSSVVLEKMATFGP